MFENHRKKPNMVNLSSFGKLKLTVLPDNLLIGQSRWKIPKLKNSNETFLGDFPTMGEH